MTPPGPPALVAIVGKSDSGKTTFIERLLPELIALGLRVGTVKHDAHTADIDHEGKDSWRHGRAGAAAYVVSSPSQLAYVAKAGRGGAPRDDRAALLRRLRPRRRRGIQRHRRHTGSSSSASPPATRARCAAPARPWP